ncbi:MAG: hypothetical protein RL318_2394 [Fibrobacterota bacterium]|jgi:DNA-binding NtrC family response regulator
MTITSGPCMQLEENGKLLTRWDLERRLVSIGSGPACQIRIEDPSVRTLCGYVLFQMGRYRIRSLDPRAGLRLNGAILEGEADLCPGDIVELGTKRLRFSQGNEPASESSPRDVDFLAGRESGEIRQIMAESFAAVARILRRHEPDAALVEIALSAGRILRCDGVRLIVKAPGDALWKTLASHPQGADPGRFSGSVLRMAQESGTTVHLGQADLAGLPAAESVMLNDIRSVLCAPLELTGPEDGFLYIDRLAGHPPFEPADRALFEALRGLFGELVEAVLRADRQRREIESLQNRASGEGKDLILHESEAMQKLLREVARVAGTEVPVLVTGETGTGKELMARHIHLSGPRRPHPFVAINCGAIPETLMESELFGHEKGAFTGAHSTHAGLIETANSGTLFLDEIGEMPLSLQVKLLRVLQQGEIVRVGGSQTIPVDFRLVCATNRNLKDEVAAGRFRSDLFFRINVIEMRLPALRERGRDSLLIAHQLVHRFASQYGLGDKTLGRLAEKAILEHRWPGNVRELENVIHKAVILSMGGLISPEDLGLGGGTEGLMELGLESDLQMAGSLRAVRDHAEKRCIETALETARGNISLTARMLDVDRKVLMRIMERLGIQADEHRPGP